MSNGDQPIERERSHDRATLVRLILAGLLAVILIAFAIDNRESVRVGWIVGDGKAPMVLVLLMAAVVGAAIGWLALHSARRGGRRRRRDQES